MLYDIYHASFTLIVSEFSAVAYLILFWKIRDLKFVARFSLLARPRLLSPSVSPVIIACSSMRFSDNDHEAAVHAKMAYAEPRKRTPIGDQPSGFWRDWLSDLKET